MVLTVRLSWQVVRRTPVLRAKKVMLSTQADYDAYHEEHARQWEAYYAGESDELGPDMEVAEGPTVAVAPAPLLRRARALRAAHHRADRAVWGPGSTP